MARTRSGQCQRQTFWARTDEIRTKLEAGEIAVGAANRLQMQAWEDFRIAQVQAKSAVTDPIDARRQAAATALLQNGNRQ